MIGAYEQGAFPAWMTLPALALLLAIILTLRFLANRHTARYLARMEKEKQVADAFNDERVARFQADLQATLHAGDAEREARFEAETLRPLQRTPRQLWIASHGAPAIARVISAKQTNTHINLKPVVELALEIPGPGGPYEVQTQVVASLPDIASIQPGAMVNVRIDPANRSDVVVLC